GMQHDALGLEAWAQLVQRSLDGVGHRHCVGAILRRYVDYYAELAVNRGAADRWLRRLDHLSDIAKCNARRSLAEQHGLRDVVYWECLALGLEDHTLVLGVDEAGTAHAGRAARCCQDVVQAQVIPDDLVWVDLDLDGATVAAKGHHLCDARDGEQSRTNRPVSNCAQLH